MPPAPTLTLCQSKGGRILLPPEPKKRYEAFFAATENGAILGRKTTILIQLAAAMVAGCHP